MARMSQFNNVENSFQNDDSFSFQETDASFYEEPLDSTVTQKKEKPTPLFTSKEQVSDLVAIAIETERRLTESFEKLNDGQISDDLSINERTQCIKDIENALIQYHQIAPKILEKINDNIISLKGLQVESTVDFTSFDHLLGDVEKGHVPTSQVNFQELYD